MRQMPRVARRVFLAGTAVSVAFAVTAEAALITAVINDVSLRGVWVSVVAGAAAGGLFMTVAPYVWHSWEVTRVPSVDDGDRL